MFYVWLAVAVLVDQIAKFLVKSYMQIGESIPVIQGVFHLTSHRNPGAAWGILTGQKWLLISIAVVVIVVGIYYSRRIENRLLKTGLALFLGGALGNVIDRVSYGEVVDFFDVRVIEYPIFNTADTLIVLGAGLMFLASWKHSK